MKKIICLLTFFWITLSFSGLYAQERGIPKKGEIISTFLERNNRPGRKYYKAFVELNKKRLGPKVILKHGLTYRLPPLEGKRDVKTAKEDETEADVSERRTTRSRFHEPLFGSSLADVKVSSKRLSHACFYIVSGHGGPDPGAIGKLGEVELHEDEYAYDIAIRLARLLMQEGAEVYLIIQDAKDGIRDDRLLTNSKRETCMGDPIPLNQVQRLQQRCDKINALYRKDRKRYTYCRALFIHVDSRSKKQQTDVFFYHSEHKSESKNLATTLKNTFESKYDKHQPNRGFTGTVSGRNLFVLTHTTPVSAFVELGNIQNAFDQQRFVMSSNRQALAKWLCEGFLKDAKK
ncbi:MAG: N-acetylmuramoyl-L-alanine amidase [Bacteroides sp.]